MSEHLGEQFRSLKYFERKPLRIEGDSFESCLFDNCSIAAPESALGRAVIRNVVLKNVSHLACSISGAVIDSVSVEGLARVGRIPLFLSGVVFRRTTVRGKIHLFKLHRTPWIVPTPEQVAFWDAANRAFYAAVDWALDISEAVFTFGPDLHFVPGHLVRINPETQAYVSRANLRDVDLGQFRDGQSALWLAIQWFLSDSPYDTTVIAAGGAKKSFAADVEFINGLKARGLAQSSAA